MKYLFLILGYLAIALPCDSIESHVSNLGSPLTSYQPHAIPGIVSRTPSRILPRWIFRGEHKDGEPYREGSPYFGYELPEDTSNWMPTGSFDSTIHYNSAPKFQSINPATGQLRRGRAACTGTGFAHIVIPDDAECCRTMLSFVCRTYKLKPKPYQTMSGVVSVVANGRATAADADKPV